MKQQLTKSLPLLLAGLLACGFWGFMAAAKYLGKPHAQRVNGWSVGGYYSVQDGETDFSIAKVLVVEPGAVHVRLYMERFAFRPLTIEPAKLSLGSIHDAEGFGVGHLPLREETFRSWQPQFISQSSVSREELEGYEIWKEGGGVW